MSSHVYRKTPLEEDLFTGETWRCFTLEVTGLIGISKSLGRRDRCSGRRGVGESGREKCCKHCVELVMGRLLQTNKKIIFRHLAVEQMNQSPVRECPRDIQRSRHVGPVWRRFECVVHHCLCQTCGPGSVWPLLHLADFWEAHQGGGQWENTLCAHKAFKHWHFALVCQHVLVLRMSNFRQKL